jgi:hypothetical protein
VSGCVLSALFFGARNGEEFVALLAHGGTTYLAATAPHGESVTENVDVHKRRNRKRS